MVAPRLLPFDAHNHIQLGPPPPSPFVLSPPPEIPHHEPPTVLGNPTEIDRNEENNGASGHVRTNDVSNEEFLVRSLSEYIRHELRGKHLSGMALMATHPRDFATLLGLERELQQADRDVAESISKGGEQNGDGNGEDDEASADEEATTMKLVPCLGVHPWFLHELDADGDWEPVPSPHCAASSPPDLHGAAPAMVPRWIANLESILASHPHLSVGEIGLDNFHFDPVTKELTTPMDKQVEAFKLQLEVAVRWRRPVSLHCVRAMGKLVNVLDDVAEENFRRLSTIWNDENGMNTGDDDCRNDWGQAWERHILPPRIYFHAFGGKAATATQLINTLEKPRRIKIRGATSKNKKFTSVVTPKIYFGFAPPVNFQSPKTASVIRAVGLERLVLETDREDIRMIGADMEAGTAWISEVLGITKDELVLATNNNARDLYGY